MRSMATETFLMKRRTVLGAGSAAIAAGALGLGPRLSGAARAEAAPCASLLTAARIGGIDRAAVIAAESVSDFALPGRAHAALGLPRTGEVLMVARRPGRFAAFVDPSRAPEGMRLIMPVPNHRFAGHAAVKANGEIITAELHEETAAAVAVLRSDQSGAVRAVWPLGGLEPHDLVVAGDRLIVALGGIEKSATVKGPALNAGHIESAIVELDANSGHVLHRHVLPESMRSLSMRHLALSPDGDLVAFGIQDQDRSQLRPLAGVLRPGKGLDLLPLPADDPGALRFYVGSVAIDAAAQYVAMTSPKGGYVSLWSLANGRHIGGVALADVCGLAAGTADGFWATSGLGDVVRIAVGGDVVRIAVGGEGVRIAARWHADASFDNHLLRLA
jgi:hypothetical protein